MILVHDCLIIGSGIAGLLAAQALQNAGQRVVVLDKARRIGGRMATRRIENGVFDYGVQFFTVREPRFKAFVDHWLAEGLVREWASGFVNSAGELQQDGHPRYCGTQGMATIPKHLAQSVDVRLNRRVVAISAADECWAVEVEREETFHCRALILTPPVPQCFQLLDAGNYVLPQAERDALAAIKYQSCLAVMALLDAPGNVPEPGGVQLDGELIGWIGDNHRKGISPAYALTILGAPDFSREHISRDRAAAAEMLLEAAAPYIGDAKVILRQQHRWFYNEAVEMYPAPCLPIPGALPLVFAGDTFTGPRVEGAALSGLAAADYLLTVSH